MAYLTEEELKQIYPKAVNMNAGDITTYLMRANGYAFGKIGGTPPVIPGDDGSNLKTAVAMAFEIFSKDESDQVDEASGNITAAAPAGAFVRSKERDPLAVVDAMLEPYAVAFQAMNSKQSGKGARFL